MKMKNEECRLTKILYVFDLEVNLFSEKRFTRKRLKGSFDDDDLYMHTKQDIEVIKALVKGGIYVVDRITSKFDELALTAIYEIVIALIVAFMVVLIVVLTSTTLSVMIDFDLQHGSHDSVEDNLNEHDSEHSTEELNTSAKKRNLYELWHRRLGHLSSKKLKGMHQVTTLKRPISIVEQIKSCEVCVIIKMTNKRNRNLSKRKPHILAGVSIDICDPLSISREDYEYFLEIIDNYSRRTWHIPLRKRSDAVEALHKWKLKTKLQCQAKLQAVRSDNVKELKSVLNEWCNSIGIVSEYTVLYNSIQNGIAERGIKTIENQIRAMIQDVGLLMEFWLEADLADAYIRDRVATRPIVDDDKTSPIQAFTGIKPSIDHLRVWGCKCYSSVDTKSLLEGSRTDKLVNRGRSNVFMSYDENITTQYRIWASDRRDIIKHHKVIFFEHEK